MTQPHAQPKIPIVARADLKGMFETLNRGISEMGLNGNTKEQSLTLRSVVVDCEITSALSDTQQSSSPVVSESLGAAGPGELLVTKTKHPFFIGVAGKRCISHPWLVRYLYQRVCPKMLTSSLICECRGNSLRENYSL